LADAQTSGKRVAGHARLRIVSAPVTESSARRLLVWHVTETAGFESAWVELTGLQLTARGAATGQRPEPYSLSYVLETDAQAATTLLHVRVRTIDDERELELLREGVGWTVNRELRADLAGALDCDLACSPLTNTMPIIRHRLQRDRGAEQFTMAFVQLPSLAVVAVPQRYEHLAAGADGASVRYSSGDFSADLLVDEDGFVIAYPTMARRLTH
jgi:hypothetical protein